MNNLDHNKNSFKQILLPSDNPQSVVSVPYALQEIIDILKQPFQTSCDPCNGLGFVNSGQHCPTCDGSGKVIDNFFK